jgi:hypothetical protein
MATSIVNASARQEEIRDVCARNQQHERDHEEERHQRPFV